MSRHGMTTAMGPDVRANIGVGGNAQTRQEARSYIHAIGSASASHDGAPEPPGALVHCPQATSS
jgi:hypothetical protein